MRRLFPAQWKRPYPRMPASDQRYGHDQLSRREFREISVRLSLRGGEFPESFAGPPEQDGDCRYGAAYAYLEALASRNPAFHVTFEHRADLVSVEELDAIYERVALLLTPSTGHTDTPCRNRMQI
ncbi:hypothetical protein NDS46_19680 [Paenibacillus thiaminolyticus]|uniref:hypothetical protein n=1 Tax=Paenibacillus thiaminolyticus TaxID=49283 RepID=UPI00232C224E|nr:hypothetical protein [Paenibacillus thiaminolyticus]WCF06563.1 hypothetical protein NDS46_19680 [Paenibacillus thiaminolyticus]